MPAKPPIKQMQVIPVSIDGFSLFFLVSSITESVAVNKSTELVVPAKPPIKQMQVIPVSIDGFSLFFLVSSITEIVVHWNKATGKQER